eukprot:CAMPEP_0113472370 /NCGR_PEP_ID=MMETSP0014_2-20120614/17479_1 /TAXON_ID=2857 /ORGANISM="Nitzschia sp." /LENGTH=810 /DNA_ID=CAMNT_0000365075 /DNA_START=364 /DNA_END=2796 /DNA_ORIENTATION=- /assembly_acc=CAM_ASM_000159
MPTVRFGFFHCDFCGGQFDTGDDASRHEVQCPNRTTAALSGAAAAPMPPYYHHPYYMQQQQAQQGHHHQYHQQQQQQQPQQPQPQSPQSRQGQGQGQYYQQQSSPITHTPVQSRRGGRGDHQRPDDPSHTKEPSSPHGNNPTGATGQQQFPHHMVAGYNQQQQQQPFEHPSMSSFPFYHDRDRSWKCRFCIDVPEFQRHPQSVWTSPDGGPPPAGFIDQHLNVCPSYQQAYTSSSPAAATAAAAAGGGGGGYMMPYHHHPYDPYGYQAAHYFPYGSGGAPHPNAATSSYMAEQGEPHSSKSSKQPGQQHTAQSKPAGAVQSGPGRTQAGHHASSRNTKGGSNTQVQGRSSNPGPISYEHSETTRQSIDYLIRFDDEYWGRDVNSAHSIPKLVLDEDKLLLTDYFYFLMKQLRLCRFSEADRKTRGGKREKIKIGFGGLQCIHCSDLPMSRKFFWSNVDRLANSFAEIPGHVLKCRRCPQQTKDSLLHLKTLHPDQMSKLPRGSQKVFFRRMWRRIHDDDDDEALDPEKGSPGGARGPEGYTTGQPPLAISTGQGHDDSPHSNKSPEISPMSGGNTISSNDSVLVIQRTASEAANALSFPAHQGHGPSSPSSKVLLSIPEDKEWLSEKDCYIRRQIEVFYATEEDVTAAQRDRMFPISVGTIGFRCLHCALAKQSKPGDHAVFYPLSVSGIYESVREFSRLHLDSCKNLPATTREKLNGLQGASSLSSVLRKYYNLGARALGLYDSKDGIRSGGKPSPIGAQAAFTFSEDDQNNFEETKPLHDEFERKRNLGSFSSQREEEQSPQSKARKT